MSPSILRSLLGSCLALGVLDLAWLTANAGRMAKGTPTPSLVDESVVAAPSEPLPVFARPALPAPPEVAPSPPPAAPQTVVRDEEITSCSVQFDRSVSTLRAEEAANLTAIGETMKRHPRAVVRVSGHADRVGWKGNRGDNLTLSDDRARAVVRALGQLGILPERIRRTAFGDAKPLDARASEEAYRRNRRVEVRVDLTGDR